MSEPNNDQPTPLPDAEPQSMEWLYDTMDRKDPERGPRPRRGFPCVTVVLLLAGIAIIAGALVLLFGPPLAATEPEATATATATLVLPTPTVKRTAQPALLPTASAAITTTTPDNTFAIGDRVVITGTGERGVRIRAGAGLGFLTQGIYQDGDAFFVLPASEPEESYPVEIDGYMWWRVRAVDGLIGWAAEDFLLPAPLISETPVP
jgi:hypothetical protein